MYPKHIEGSWQFSGPWLGSYRLIADDIVVVPIVPQSRDITCPICEYPEAIRLGTLQPDFPLMYYCPECNTVWAWYAAKCPDCDGLIWNKDCPEGSVKCSVCDMEWDEESVREINEDPEFHNEEEYDGT